MKNPDWHHPVKELGRKDCIATASGKEDFTVFLTFFNGCIHASFTLFLIKLHP